MSSFRIRPRFAHTVNTSLDDTRQRLLEAFAQQSAGFEVKTFPGYLSVYIAEKERTFWSPRLSLSLQETAGDVTLIEGTYGPDAEVWSLFLYGYLFVGLVGTFAGIFGCAQLFIDHHPWGLWVAGSMAVLAGLLYLGAQLGQKFGAWQTFQLHQAYQNAIGRPAEIT